MANLTPEELNRIQGRIDTVRAGVNALTPQVSALNKKSPTMQPGASGSVLSAADIKPQSQIKVNELTGKAPDLASTFADNAGMKAGADMMQKQIDEQKKQQEQVATQKTSLWDKISGAKTSDQVMQDTSKEIGFDTAQYLATRKSDIAELDSLEKQYQQATGFKDQALLNDQSLGAAGASQDFINRKMSRTEKEWNIRLNQMGGVINTKTAIMKLKDEDYTTASQYIQKAIDNNTADLKLKYDQFNTLEQENKDLLDNIGDNYKTLYDTAKAFALEEYQTTRNEKTQIGNLMAEYSDAPWTANSMSLSLGEASQIAKKSQRYKNELAKQEADIAAQKANTYQSYAAGYKALADSNPDSLGLDASDPIYMAINGLGSVAAQERSLKVYTELKKSGQDERASEYLDSIAFLSLSGTARDEFITYSTAASGLDKVIGKFGEFKTANPSLYKTALESAKPIFGASKDQTWVKFVSEIEASQTKIRRGLFGTALTPNETQNSSKFLIDWKADDVNTIETKLGNIRQFLDDTRSSMLAAGQGNYYGDVSGSRDSIPGTNSIPAGSTGSGTTVMSGPDGTFNVPNNQIELFKKNGYK